MQTWGLQWNMLSGSIPDSWRNLRAKSVWVRPGNYQLCGSKPANATFELCKEIDGKCALFWPCLFESILTNIKKSSLGAEVALSNLLPPNQLSSPAALDPVMQKILSEWR